MHNPALVPDEPLVELEPVVEEDDGMDELAFLNDAAANAVDPGALMARALIRHNYHFFLAANVALNAPDKVLVRVREWKFYSNFG